MGFVIARKHIFPVLYFFISALFSTAVMATESGGQIPSCPEGQGAYFNGTAWVCEDHCPSGSGYKHRDDDGGFTCSECPDPGKVKVPATDGMHDFACVCPEGTTEGEDGGCIGGDGPSSPADDTGGQIPTDCPEGQGPYFNGSAWVCEEHCPSGSGYKHRDDSGGFTCSECPDPGKVKVPATDGMHDFACVCPEGTTEGEDRSCVEGDDTSSPPDDSGGEGGEGGEEGGTPPDDSTRRLACPSGFVESSVGCVPDPSSPACPLGSVRNVDGSCIPTADCPQNYMLQSGGCIPPEMAPELSALSIPLMCAAAYGLAYRARRKNRR